MNEVANPIQQKIKWQTESNQQIMIFIKFALSYIQRGKKLDFFFKPLNRSRSKLYPVKSLTKRSTPVKVQLVIFSQYI